MVPTLDYIQARFDEYNARFFGGSLPPIPIKLSHARTFLGKVTFVRHRTWLFGAVRNEKFVLRINTRFDLPEELIEDTILHEMIHYYIAVNQLRGFPRLSWRSIARFCKRLRATVPFPPRPA